ncbi:MAG: hypothetical protein HYT40_02615 [Candidatus Sungbacteria bacterium]|uniref:Uncharacterized protein n=1 Tax=Candidatus Sungiibacteriota bacterium TaxID=2750080 RepID=A0A931SBS7_9BACT|nr:hypothetical protein [Candidatus Sungbacteria bacterium]
MAHKIGVVRVTKFTKWTLLRLVREILRDQDKGVNPEAKLGQLKEAYRQNPVWVADALYRLRRKYAGVPKLFEDLYKDSRARRLPIGAVDGRIRVTRIARRTFRAPRPLARKGDRHGA